MKAKYRLLVKTASGLRALRFRTIRFCYEWGCRMKRVATKPTRDVPVGIYKNNQKIWQF